MSVRLADINFDTKEGAATALGRIEAAADVVCGGKPDVRDLYRRGLFADCRKIAVQHAIDDLKQPLLSAIVAPSMHPAKRFGFR